VILLKNLSLLVGVFLIIISSVKIGLYFINNPSFSDFGTGFILGNLLLFILGIFLLMYGKRLKGKK
jgi:hypothetical protein